MIETSSGRGRKRNKEEGVTRRKEGRGGRSDKEEGVTRRRERRGECYQALVNDRKLHRLPYRKGKTDLKNIQGANIQLACRFSAMCTQKVVVSVLF